AVLRHQVDPMCDGVLRSLDFQGLTLERDFSVECFFDSEDCSCNFRTPSSHESGKSKHLTFRNAERDRVIRIPQCAQPPHFKTYFARRRSVIRGAFEEIFEVATDHHSDHSLVSNLGSLDLPCILPVA